MKAAAYNRLQTPVCMDKIFVTLWDQIPLFTILNVELVIKW